LQGKEEKTCKPISTQIYGHTFLGATKLAPVPEHIDNIKSSFSSAVKRAGIENFTFHDLRHTFASHFVMQGGSLRALQQILGHRKIETTMRYAHLSPDHKIKAVNLLNGLTALSENAHGTKWAQMTIPKFRPVCNYLKLLVGTRGFEPPAP